MSADDEVNSDVPLPRQTQQFFGHAAAEQTLLDAYRSRRIPHAWLISGPRGVGKATLAYRLARFVFAHPDPGDPAVQEAPSLAIDSDHPASRRIAMQGQPDLLVLERTVGDKGKLRQDIAVADVRRSVPFFGSTAGEGGWRIAIVDSVDELNEEGANALLKVVEEPPPRALLLMISHAPGLVLPTIRSRCRLLNLRPLAADDVAGAAAAALGRQPEDPDVREAASLAEGSVGRAVGLLQGNALRLREHLTQLLDKLPETDPLALHALGDAMAGANPEPLVAFRDTINAWLSGRLTSGKLEKREMGRLAEVWEQVNRAAAETEEYNLERKPLVFSVFGLLADTARR